MMGKAIEEADNHQNQRIRHHHNLVSDIIDNPADNRCREEAGDGGYGKQQADDAFSDSGSKPESEEREKERQIFGVRPEDFRGSFFVEEFHSASSVQIVSKTSNCRHHSAGSS